MRICISKMSTVCLTNFSPLLLGLQKPVEWSPWGRVASSQGEGAINNGLCFRRWVKNGPISRLERERGSAPGRGIRPNGSRRLVGLPSSSSQRATRC